MRDWKRIEAELLKFHGQTIVWHSDTPAEVKREWCAHAIKVIADLSAIINLSVADVEKEKRLRDYLALRWQLIKGTSVDYTFHPQFPMNRACLRVAEFLVKADEALCQVLMPTISHVIGSPDITLSIKDQSEDAEGLFIPAHFLSNSRGDALIDLQSFLDYGKEDTDRIFAENPLFALTEKDQKNLYHCLPEVGAYFDALDLIHRAKIGEKMSWGTLLRHLQKRLLKASRKKNGTETQADFSECEESIRGVAQYWRQLQHESKATYEKIAGYDLGVNTHSLEQFLIAVFSSVSEVVLSEDELTIASELKNNITFYCSEQLQQMLSALLAAHPDLDDIPLPGYAGTFVPLEVPPAEDLRELSNAVARKLGSRFPMLGVEGDVALRKPFFAELSAYYTTRMSLEMLFSEERLIARQTGNLRNLSQLLLMLPTEVWSRYFSCFNRSITRALTLHQDQELVLMAWFHGLPVAYWPAFFSAVSSVGAIRTHINPWTVPIFFKHSPEGHWKDLYVALSPYWNALFATDVNLVCFLRVIASRFSDWILIGIFLPEIKRVFEKTPDFEGLLVTVVEIFDKREWRNFLSVLMPAIQGRISNVQSLQAVLSKVTNLENRRHHLLVLLLEMHRALVIQPLGLFSLLGLCNEKDWPDVFKALGSERLNKYIFDAVTLSAFLAMFLDLEARKKCAAALALTLSFSESMTSVDLCGILRTHACCSGSIMTIFKSSLSDSIGTMLMVCAELKARRLVIPKELQEDFLLLARHIFPYVLEKRRLFILFPSIEARDLGEAARQLMLDFSILESVQGASWQYICRRKIDYLKAFFKDAPEDAFLLMPVNLKVLNDMEQSFAFLPLGIAEVLTFPFLAQEQSVVQRQVAQGPRLFAHRNLQTPAANARNTTVLEMSDDEFDRAVLL